MVLAAEASALGAAGIDLVTTGRSALSQPAAGYAKKNSRAKGATKKGASYLSNTTGYNNGDKTHDARATYLPYTGGCHKRPQKPTTRGKSKKRIAFNGTHDPPPPTSSP